RDAEALCAERGELRGQIAEVARLLGATLGHRGGVKEENHRSVQQNRRECEVITALVLEFEVGGEVTCLHQRRLRVEPETNSADGDEVPRVGGIVLDLLA